MRKRLMIAGLLVLCLTSCGKTEAATETTEAVTEEVIVEKTEKPTVTTEEEVISSGSEEGTEEIGEEATEDPADALEGIAFNRKRRLPETVEPLPDARGFNPRIVNADLFEIGEYYRKELGLAVYMLLEYRNIQEDPTEIELISREESPSGLASYRAILKFDKHEDMDVEIFYYDMSYSISEYVGDDFQSYEEDFIEDGTAGNEDDIVLTIDEEGFLSTEE